MKSRITAFLALILFSLTLVSSALGAGRAQWPNTTNYSVYLTHLGSDGDVCDVATCGVDWNSGRVGTYRKINMPVPSGGGL